MSNQQIEKLIAIYNESKTASKFAGRTAASNIELEVRLDNINDVSFNTLLSAVTEKFGQGTYTTTVDIISSDIVESKLHNIRHIETRQFIDNKLHNTTYSTKESLSAPLKVVDYIGYRIGVSRETPVKPFESTSTAIIRHKNRFSVLITETHKWRLDMTIVNQRDLQDKDELRRIRQATMGAKNISDAAIPGCSYEVELELLDVGDAELTPGSFAIVAELFAMLNPAYKNDMSYQTEIYELALDINHPMPSLFRSPNNRLKRLLPQVVAINKSTYSGIPDITGYYVTVKLDGERALVSYNGEKCVVLMSMTHMMFNLRTTPVGNGKAPVDKVIVDCEIIMRDDGIFDIYPFDVIKIGDRRLTSGLEERITHLNAACEIISRVIPRGCRCLPKQYTKISNPQKDITHVWTGRDKKSPIDGLIFVEPDQKYFETKSYKWKPTENNTIDFVVKKCPPAMAGTPPYIAPPGKTCFLLFVGISYEMRRRNGAGFINGYSNLFPNINPQYCPIQFSPSYDPLAYIWYYDSSADLDGKVVELSMRKNPDGKCDWVFHRVRDDRKLGATYYGNDMYTAETIYMNYVNEFTLEDLWLPVDSYFKKTADIMYRAPNGMKRYVITMKIREHFTNCGRLIDAAAGRGADISRYRDAGVAKLLAIDNDSLALAELIDKRKYTDKTGGNQTCERFPGINSDSLIASAGQGMRIYTALADLRQDPAELIKRCEKYGFVGRTADGLVCNFALHYFCGEAAHLANFFKFAGELCSPGARFLFTTMDGASVFAALRGGPWRRIQDERIKYEITAKYKDAKLARYGQMIEIRLPFSYELMTEPLCNITEVLAVASEHGFKLVSRQSFGEFLPGFAKSNKAGHANLTADDIEYINLHTCVVLERKK